MTTRPWNTMIIIFTGTVNLNGGYFYMHVQFLLLIKFIHYWDRCWSLMIWWWYSCVFIEMLLIQMCFQRCCSLLICWWYSCVFIFMVIWSVSSKIEHHIVCIPCNKYTKKGVELWPKCCKKKRGVKGFWVQNIQNCSNTIGILKAINKWGNNVKTHGKCFHS